MGNLDAKRDWGYAPEYVEGMWRMLQHDTPDVYVLATGHSATVREFVTLAAAAVGMELTWQGTGPDERAIDQKTGKSYRQGQSQVLPSGRSRFLTRRARQGQNVFWVATYHCNSLNCAA